MTDASALGLSRCLTDGRVITTVIAYTIAFEALSVDNVDGGNHRLDRKADVLAPD